MTGSQIKPSIRFLWLALPLAAIGCATVSTPRYEPIAPLAPRPVVATAAPSKVLKRKIGRICKRSGPSSA